MKTFTRKALLISLSFFLLHSLQAQKMLDPTDTIVNYDSTHPPVQPAYGMIGKWVRTPSMDWNTSAYKCYIYKGSDFRLHFPQTYKPGDGKKYPILVFYHGDGEIGPIYDNETTLRNGGLLFHKMENSGTYDGYIIVMQTQYGWGPMQFNSLNNLIDTLVQEYGGDPYRVVQNGLSGGGQGIWEHLDASPTYFAAACIMSAALTGYATPGVVDTLKYTPIWDLDGGLDSNPAPYTAQQVAAAYLGQGANYAYTDFTTLGHGTWDSTWDEPNFWPFVNNAYQSNPWPLFDNTTFCPGTPIKVTMGIVPGLDGYQWRRNDTIIPGAVSDSLIATQPGTYDARVLRGSTWSDWSHTPVIISSGLPPLTHTVTQPNCTVAKGSIVITAPRGDTIYYSLNGQPFTTTATWDSLSAGIYNITIRDSKCNNATLTDTIQAQPVTPNRPVTTAIQPSCTVSGGTISIAPQDTTFQWTIYNGKYYSSKVKYTDLGPQTYIVTAESQGGCVSQKDTVVIDSALVVPAMPGVDITQPTCSVPTGQISIKTSPADTGLTYAINGGSYQSASVFKNLQGGQYAVTSRNSTCASRADTVTIDPAKVTPSTPAVTLQQPTCTVATGEITVTSPISSSDTGQNALTYSINGSSYQPAPQFQGVASGTYAVTVENSEGCVSSSAAAVIQVQPKAPGAPMINVTQPTCTTGSGTITIAGADTTSLSYSVNGSAYLAQSSFPNLTIGSYNVTAQNSAGCVSAAAKATIDSLPGAPPAPIVVIIQPTCTLPTGSITVTSPIGAGYTYRIADSAAFEPVPLFNIVPPGTYYVSAKGGQSGCVSLPATAIVNPSPALAKPTVTVTQASCRINTGSITVTSPADTGLLYSIDGIDYQPDSVISPVSPGTYQVTIKDDAGCVSPAAAAQILNPPTSCAACAAAQHSNFDGFQPSANPGSATTLWFNLHASLDSGQLAKNGDYLLFTGGNLVFSGVGASSDSAVDIPDGEILADNTVATPSTSFVSAKNLWITRVPVGYVSNDVFVSGAAINSSTGFQVSGPGGTSILSGSWTSDTLVNSTWWYGLACYQPEFDNTTVGSINAADGAPVGGHIAGTPNDQAGNLVAGGSGSGGSNYTGNLSAADNLMACVVQKVVPKNIEMKVYPNPYTSTVYFTVNSSVSATGTLEFYNLVGDKLSVIQDLQFQAGVPQTITVPMLTIGARQPVVYVFWINGERIQGTLLPER